MNCFLTILSGKLFELAHINKKAGFKSAIPFPLCLSLILCIPKIIYHGHELRPTNQYQLSPSKCHQTVGQTLVIPLRPQITLVLHKPVRLVWNTSPHIASYAPGSEKGPRNRINTLCKHIQGYILNIPYAHSSKKYESFKRQMTL